MEERRLEVPVTPLLSLLAPSFSRVFLILLLVLFKYIDAIVLNVAACLASSESCDEIPRENLCRIQIGSGWTEILDRKLKSFDA